MVRQRPGTASGILFITLEDETGISNLVVFKKFFDKYRKDILQAKLLLVEGKLQKEGEVIHIIVQRCVNMNRLLNENVPAQQELALAQSRADEKDEEALSPTRDKRIFKPSQTDVFFEGRNFK